MADLVEFHCDAVKDGTLTVETAHGSEEISSPFRFDVDMVSDDDKIDPAKVVLSKAWVGLKQAVDEKKSRLYKVYGVVSSFEMLDKFDKRVRYRATVVPSFWKLTLSRRNRVFLDLSVKDLIKKVFDDNNVDVQIKTSGTYEKHEFITQHNESDFDFVSRWLEHEGIFYYFDHSGDKDKVVFADKAASYAAIPGESNIAYRPTGSEAARGGKGVDKDAVILSFRCRQEPLPKEVFLADWNHRNPSEKVEGKAAVDSKGGFGTVYEYGNHALNASHAKALATVRAEALLCRQKVFSGGGTCRPFRSGLTFDLKEHYRFNGKYMITSVQHEVSQPSDAGSGANRAASYRNQFTCIPSSVLFRPERRTPWPQVSGLLSAQVTTGKDHAEVDEHGRYKIRFMYDSRDSKKPAGSHYVRMAQPHAGKNEGFHFPLHPDTEVIVGHANGDPDRPLILGSLPNPDTKSPVLSQNTTQNVIKTSGNNIIRLEDKKDAQDFFLHAEKDLDKRVKNDEKIYVGNEAHRIVKKDELISVEADQNVTVGKNKMESIGENLYITVGKNAGISTGTDLSAEAGANLVLEAGTNASIKTGANIVLKGGANIVIEGMGGITLKAGSGSVVIDPSGVTLKGPVVTVDGSMAKINSGPGSPPKPGKPGKKVSMKKPKDPKEAVKP